MKASTSIDISLGARSYSICCGSGVLAGAGNAIAGVFGGVMPRCIVVSDTNVAPLYQPGLVEALTRVGADVPPVIILPAGEGSKSFSVFEGLVEDILALQPDRNTCLIALGGGVIGDITGFAASVILRGLPFVQIPTSLLAQVDSSVGGKTAINSKAGKNLIGSFYQPKLVLADTDTLQTLPMRELKAGYAEVLKYALLGDADFFAWLEQHGKAILAGDAAIQQDAILRCCRQKAAIVAADETEKGQRALLNLGHTFGHALEQACGYDGTLLHGEAVAIGMVLAAQLSARLGLCEPDVASAIVAHLTRLGVPYDVSYIARPLSAELLLAAMYGDKKAEAGTLTFIMLTALGRACIEKHVSENEVLAVLSEAVEKKA